MIKNLNDYIKRIRDMNAEQEQNRKRNWLELEAAVLGVRPLPEFNLVERNWGYDIFTYIMDKCSPGNAEI